MGAFFAITATGTVWPHLLLPVTQIFALALPPFPYRSAIFVPLICTLVLLTWRNLCTDSVDLRSLMIGQWPWYLGTLAKLLFYVPERDFWRADREKHEALRMTGLSGEKWKWAAALYCSPRLVGWNQQVKGVPLSATPNSRKEFVIERLKLLALCFGAIDLCNVYNHTYYYRPYTDPMTLTVRGAEGATVYRSILNYAIGLAGVFFPFTWLYNQIAVVSVLAGGGQPKDWPHFYGPISSTYTLRNFWNTYWHQTARHMLVAYAGAFKRIFGIQRGTWLSSYSELYLCFTLSALFHGISTYALPIPAAWRSDLNTRFWMWFNFMFWQAAAIHVEDGVIWAWRNAFGSGAGGEGKANGEAKNVNKNDRDKHTNNDEKQQSRVGTKDKAKGGERGKPAVWQMALGFVWVYTFWYWIDPWTVDPLLRLGVVAGNPLPFSIVEPILKMTGTRDYVTRLIVG